MKILVVYYSRTGVTRQVGEAIAGALNGDGEEIVDLKDRSGSIGYINAGRDATFKLQTKIKPLEKQPADYDLVIIGTPVWAWNMTPAARTYIVQNKERFVRCAFFCTMGGAGGERTIRKMSELAGKKHPSSPILLTKEVVNNQYEDKVKKFIAELW
ncbi:NAD(P)H-dependent oxidoreductase [Candidatus Falkowbacteria bacterium]|nr:NAD(P)H-dependent oxidoreductase [Candidatus Falkowbacteria bacterium]